MGRLMGVFLLTCSGLLLLSAVSSKPAAQLATPGGTPPAPHNFQVDFPLDPKAPVLVVEGGDNPFSAYYAEILKAEGLNLFTAIQAPQLNAQVLADRRVVLLASTGISGAAVSALEDWVRGGGLLITMRPGPRLLPLMGLKRASPAVTGAYLLADSQLEMSRGIVDQPIQIHGSADLYEPLRRDEPGAAIGAEPVAVAKLAGADAALPNPAVTVRRIGRGYGAAFAFDLARSVALTRQGNPLWIDQERDGSTPRRPNDLFFPDYLDRRKIAIPQADEQQRLLANLILAASGAPIPRFWYLPNRERAAIIMTGDDHATEDGTLELFATLAALSPQGCRLEHWECLRATAYLTPATRLSPTIADRYRKMGFELGVHVDTGCRDSDDPTLSAMVETQLEQFQRRYPRLPRQATHRIHCIVWNGWTDLARIQHQHGIRFDLNYYHWSPEWIGRRAGFLTGSGFPMPFIDRDGSVLDIYQAASHLVDESGVPQRQGVIDMIERALGPEQFFGAFATHYDHVGGYESILVQVARQYDVPLITAEQMLAWVDGRNGSRFEQIEWQGSRLSFVVRLAPGAEAASVMLPAVFEAATLATVTCDGEPVDFAVETIKGLEMAFLPARTGACEARYNYRGRPDVQHSEAEPPEPAAAAG